LDLETLEAFSLLLEEEIKKVEGVRKTSVFADRIVGKPYILMDIDRSKIARYGLRIEDIQQTLKVAIGGKVLGQSIEGRERYSIRIRYPRELRGTPEALKNIYVDLPNGSTMPLSEFVEISYEQGPQNIKGENGFLVSYVIFDKIKDISEVTIVEKIKRELSDKTDSGEFTIPPGVSYTFSGTFENHLHAQRTFSFIIPLVLIIILLLLYLQFRSISVSLMVFSSIAVAFSGGFILIWLYGQPWFMNVNLGFGNFRELFNMQTINLSVAVWVGFIALFGIATDDGVVMATYLKQSFKQQNPNDIKSIREVVVLAGRKRIRPCLISKTSKEELTIKAESGRWTCSMHPKVDGEEQETCPLCSMELVFISNSPNELANNQIAMSEEATALANIQTTVVDKTNSAGISLKLSGTVTTNKRTDAVQTILYDGRIDELYSSYIGKKIRSGQEIGKVYSPELYLAQDKLLTSVSYKETHKNLYESARNTLGLWKISDKQIDKMIAQGKPMISFPLYADVTGTVTEALATVGNYYKQGDPIYRVSDLRSVWVVLDAYEEQLQLLKVGQEVELRFKALPNEVIVSKVSFIEPVMQKDKRTLAVRILVKNEKGKLKPGMFTEAHIKAKSNQENVITIPKSAVLWTGKRSIVYKKPYSENSIFELVEVELGQSFTDSYEVIAGLVLGDEIVTHGAFTVDAAAQLMGKTSMMNKSIKEKHPFQYKELSPIDTKDFKPLTIDSNIGVEHLLTTYFEFKDALVTADYNLAQQQINKLNKGIEVALKNEGISTSSWKSVQKGMEILMNASDIESLRKGFKPFSNDLINIIRTTKDAPMKVYVQFCPMADEGKGASWLSLNETIENPYWFWRY